MSSEAKLHWKFICKRLLPWDMNVGSFPYFSPPLNTKWKFIFLLFQKSSKFNDKTLYFMQHEKEDARWINFILLLRIISLFVRLFIHGFSSYVENFMTGHFVCWVIKSFPLEIRRCKRKKIIFKGRLALDERISPRQRFSQCHYNDWVLFMK